MWICAKWGFEIFESEEFNDVGLLFFFEDERVPIFCFEEFSDLAYAHFVLVSQRFEQTVLPDVGQFARFAFDMARQSIVVRQSSKFSVVGKNNLSITERGQFWFVPCLEGVIGSVFSAHTEFLQPTWGMCSCRRSETDLNVV